MPSEVALTCVDCRFFHGRFAGHVGLHEEVQKEYLDDLREMNALVDYLIEQGVDPESFAREGAGRHGRRKHIVAFFCNAGEHRSVALAAMFAHYAKNMHCEVEIRHMCTKLWGRRSCGQCARCTDRPCSANLSAFAQYFDARRAAHARKKPKHRHAGHA